MKDLSDLDATVSHERDRQVQQLVGLADVLNGLPIERLTEVLTVTVGIDDLVRRVRQLGVPVTTEYPENDTLPIDKRLFVGLDRTSLIRTN